MDYASSYAAGAPPLGHRSGTPPRYAGDSDVVLPAPKPQRMHWSTMLFVAGMAICLLGLLATIAGVPGKVAYDVDGAPDRNKPSSMDPMQLNASIDGNMKWLAHNSSDAKGGYVGYVKSINRSEAAIPIMVQAMAAMDSSLQAIDSGLAEVGATTVEMRSHMDKMASVSGASAATMASLGEDIGFLSGSMLELAGATEELTERMAAIEKQAAGIAASGTAAALDSTRELSTSLPDEVPVPITDDGRPLDQAMADMARGGGGTGPGSGAAADVASANLDAYETGAAL